MQVVVDHREERCGIVDCLINKSDVQVKLATLSVGDYEIDQKLVFERKTLVDFCESIKDGRLFRQAEKLCLASMKPALIIEGTAKDLTGSRMSRESIQGALINLSLFWGISVLRSMGVAETAKLICYAGRQSQWITRGGVKRSGPRPRMKKKRQLYILQGLPGVGPERAETLLTHFGTVANVAQASVDEMKGVRGVGGETAKAIYQAVHEGGVTYDSETCAFVDGWV